MEELTEMRTLMLAGRYGEALVLLGEMEEMARDEKISKIESYAQVLVSHLIKQQAENRNTRLWSHAIREATRGIRRCLVQRKTGNYYLTEEEVREAVADSFDSALGWASLEAFEGMQFRQQLLTLVHPAQIQVEALRCIFYPQADDDNLDFDLPQWLK